MRERVQTFLKAKFIDEEDVVPAVVPQLESFIEEQKQSYQTLRGTRFTVTKQPPQPPTDYFQEGAFSKTLGQDSVIRQLIS